MYGSLHLSRIALVAGVLGTVFALGAGPLATPAEANRKHKSSKVHRQSHHPRTAVVQENCYPQTVVYRDHYYPRPVIRRYATPVYSRPWYYEAPQVVVASSPYYFHAGLNLYLGGVNLNLAFTDPAPAGYVYLDPYCDREFVTVADYRRHLHRHDHSPALWVEFAGY